MAKFVRSRESKSSKKDRRGRRDSGNRKDSRFSKRDSGREKTFEEHQKGRDRKGSGFSKRSTGGRRDSGREKTFEEHQKGRDRKGSGFSKRSTRDRRDSGRGSSRYSRDRRGVEMTEVTCASCGSKCKVPFKPTSNKPVYCSDCFKKKEKVSSNKDFDMINEKLNKIMKALNIK